MVEGVFQDMAIRRRVNTGSRCQYLALSRGLAPNAGPIGSRKDRHVDVVELRLDILEEEDEIENEEVIGVGRHGGVE